MTMLRVCALALLAALLSMACGSGADGDLGDGAGGGDKTSADAGAAGDDEPDGMDAVDAGGGPVVPLGVRDGRADDGAEPADTGAGDGDTAGDGDGDAASAGDGDASGGGDGDVAGDGDAEQISDAFCEIGVADAVSGLLYEPFPQDGTVPMVGTGQSDLLIELALLVYQADAPDVEIVVEADDSGLSFTYTSEAENGFVCAADMWCELVPVLLETLPLIDFEGGQDEDDLMMLPVTITLTVSDAAGPFCRRTLSAPLLRKD